MDCVVFIPADLEPSKIVNIAVYNPTLVEIKGNYDDVNRLCAEIADRYGWAFVNINLRPYYAEGSKSLAFEVAEQLGWRAPDAVVIPTASGALFTRVARGFQGAEGVIGIGGVAIEEVLGVVDDFLAVVFQILHGVGNELQVLVFGYAEGAFHVEVPGLTEDRHHGRASLD